jgi:Mrp family chromosome partitioning ATPase
LESLGLWFWGRVTAQTPAEQSAVIRTRLLKDIPVRPCILAAASGTSESRQAVLAIARSLADIDFRVSVMDADYRYVPGATQRGLTTILQGTQVLTDYTQLLEKQDGVAILPRGAGVAAPIDLLSKPRFVQLLEALRRDCDFLFILAPLGEEFADLFVVAQQANHLLYVVPTSMERAVLEGILTSVRKFNAQPAAAVMCSG